MCDGRDSLELTVPVLTLPASVAAFHNDFQAGLITHGLFTIGYSVYEHCTDHSSQANMWVFQGESEKSRKMEIRVYLIKGKVLGHLNFRIFPMRFFCFKQENYTFIFNKIIF